MEADDLRAGLDGHPDGIVIPKVESGDAIRWASAEIAAVEQRNGWPAGQIGIIVLVETALGIVNLKEIASSDPRLQALDLRRRGPGRRHRRGAHAPRAGRCSTPAARS